MSNDPFIVITADTHAGASIDAYREYLDPQYQADFDAWRGSYKNPSKKHVGSKKSKNWDSAERLADLLSDGVVGDAVDRRRCADGKNRAAGCHRYSGNTTVRFEVPARNVFDLLPAFGYNRRAYA